VLVVEHDPDMIRVADHIVDIGPKAGTRGGNVVYEGSLQGLYEADTLTGKWINRSVPVKTEFRTPTGQMKVRGGNANNLKNVDVDFPTGVLTVVTGVAGVGKSSLVEKAFLRQNPSAVVIDQSAVSTSNRSTPLTYTGIMDDVRKMFAKANKVSASLFSFNSQGACETCQGLGFIDPIKSTCEDCEGQRFRPEVLADVAAVAVKALLEDGHNGKGYVMTGPQPLTEREQVAEIAFGIGRPIRFEVLTPEQARASWIEQGMPAEVVDEMMAHSGRYDAEPPKVSDTIRELTGKPARTLRQWAADHAADFS
jgi:energy-coupling factor transporter ATP-binding protein EcfA2